jgi:gpW protein
MAWTQGDLDQVRAAVLALATGARVYSILYAGPPQRQVQYAAVDLPELRKLIAEIERSVSGATAFRRVTFSKGFDPPRNQ